MCIYVLNYTVELNSKGWECGYVCVSKACFSLQVLLGAQAGMMQLQGKLREASNPRACGMHLEQRQRRTASWATDSHSPEVPSLPQVQTLCLYSSSCSQLGCLMWTGLQGASTLPRPSSHLPVLTTYPYPHTEHCRFFSVQYQGL